MDDEDVLARIRDDGALRAALDLVGDFDVERVDPIEELELPDGERPVPIAGCASGGTYFLCGPAGTPRPVLYADSEGRATLAAADLAEALTLFTAPASWRDALDGHPLDELEEEARERLRNAARRTVPDFLPRPTGHEGHYEPMHSG
ncbi:hypothetical protein PWG71_09920 [Nocardiopsis sp. N85]|uniref:hypothetical protein n=1 Tax=Nocardiopsis sp. N85 TaxID=3029400 RepID=UPI00237F5967|nr:hypothetical protein [Nocardiopsis sp. N85]MDE3721704.1 hypothetical protein [Nocardiopsis sp. N85]